MVPKQTFHILQIQDRNQNCDKKKHLLPFYICSRYPRPACQHPFFPHLAKKIQSILEIAFSLLLVSEVSCKQKNPFAASLMLIGLSLVYCTTYLRLWAGSTYMLGK